MDMKARKWKLLWLGTLSPSSKSSPRESHLPIQADVGLLQPVFDNERQTSTPDVLPRHHRCYLPRQPPRPGHALDHSGRNHLCHIRFLLDPPHLHCRDQSGHFVYVEADQKSVDVVIDAYSPNGFRYRGVDVSGRGPDRLTFNVGRGGVQRIEIRPFRGAVGDYSITLHRVEPIAMTPEGRVDQLMAPFDDNDRPGGVVAVIRNGEIDFVRAYGMADLTHGAPNSPETLFNIGSVSKQFAGIFFAMMAEEGKLSLDDDVREYLPELPDFGDTC